MDMSREDVVAELDEFAKAHGLKLSVRGEVGFGRPCVGLLGSSENYVDYNPHKSDGNYGEVWPADERLYAPDGVEAYPKHDCFAVLCADDEPAYTEALRQLLTWVRHLKAQGDVYVERYATGATGIQALFSGTHGCALRLR